MRRSPPNRQRAQLFLYKDGSKLTTVGWHRDGDCWISNTLTKDLLTNDQILSIAASLVQ